MDKVQKQVEDYSAANPNVQVDKLLLSVETNDIRNDIRNVKEIGTSRGPLKQLHTKIVSLFPKCMFSHFCH